MYQPVTNNIAIVGSEFINLYSKENPILESGDICFFMFWNNLDYHRPLICRGEIKRDVFVGGMNKAYYISLSEILETPETIKQFVINLPFYLFNPNFSSSSTKSRMSSLHDFKDRLIKADAFFVRNTLEKIVAVRTEYLKVIRKDILKQLNDIDNI